MPDRKRGVCVGSGSARYTQPPPRQYLENAHEGELTRKSALQPRSRKTPTGGRMIAKMILMMSDPVKGILARPVNVLRRAVVS